MMLTPKAVRVRIGQSTNCAIPKVKNRTENNLVISDDLYFIYFANLE